MIRGHMTALLFEGSSLLLQGTLFDDHVEELGKLGNGEAQLQRSSSSIRQAFAAFDNEGALLVVEGDIGETFSPAARSDAMGRVLVLAKETIRRNDIAELLDADTIVICLPGSGRIGMTRVADALRQRIWGASQASDAEHRIPTVTIGAVHTTESHLVDIDELLLHARVNLDAARAAGGNRTNWSDWTELRAT